MSTCGLDRFKPEDIEEADDNNFKSEIVWECMRFTVHCVDGCIAELVCHSEPNEYFETTFLCDPVDSLQTVILRDTGCDISWDTQVEFKL